MVEGIKSKILIVDDNPDYLGFIKAAIDASGWDSEAAVSGKDALTVANRYHPDLVLLDHYLPDMTGLDVCKQFKADSALRDVPIIFLSGQHEDETRIRGLDMGGVDYITKEAGMREIVARIRAQLKSHHRQRHLDQALQSAAEIQKALLPKKAPDWPEYSFAWFFDPSEHVAGDIFNIIPIGPIKRVGSAGRELLAFYVVDVSGHGFPSALLATSVFQSLQVSTDVDLSSPSSVLQFLNEHYPFERFEKYLSIVYMVLDRSTHELCCSTAAHPFPILQKRGKPPLSLSKGGGIIGFQPEARFEEECYILEQGDRLWLFTDGLYEAVNQEEEPFGRSRLESFLQDQGEMGLSLEETVQRLHETLQDFGKGLPQKDDITFLGIEYKGEPLC